jgi:tRNA A37 threonylcarbamoyladenosine modification protein TsaB
MDVVPMLDARRQQVFSACYGSLAGGGMELRQGPVAMRPDRWLAQLDPERRYLFVGDGSRLYRPAIEAAHPGSTVLETDNQILEALCVLGFQRFAAGQGTGVADLKAIYVRPPDARLAE